MELLFFWIVCGFVTAIIAGAKGRSFIGWLLIGVLLGIFGILLIAFMPSRQQARPDARPKKRCPACAEDVMAEANVCRHCGHQFA